MSIVNKTSVLRVIALQISEDGAVSKKQMKIDRDSQLENTLLKADYPDIRVATIDIPQQQLDQYQQAPDPEGQAIDDLARPRGGVGRRPAQNDRRPRSGAPRQVDYRKFFTARRAGQSYGGRASVEGCPHDP